MAETAQSIVSELAELGSPSIKKVLAAHGAREPYFGVRIGDMKPIVKRIKVNYELSLELYATGISDAMYLAGLIADDPKMTRKDLETWVEGAYWSLHSESTVPWVAAGSPEGWNAAMDWIKSPIETTASAGWRTLSDLAVLRPDSELDLDAYSSLLDQVGNTIHQAEGRVRYCMNGFIITCGGHIVPLTDQAIQVAKQVGKVDVNMGGTSCKVPDALTYMIKVIAHGHGKKRKSVKC